MNISMVPLHPIKQEPNNEQEFLSKLLNEQTSELTNAPPNIPADETVNEFLTQTPSSQPFGEINNFTNSFRKDCYLF